MCNKTIKLKEIKADYYVNEGDIVQFELTPEYYENAKLELDYIELQKRSGYKEIKKKSLYICMPGLGSRTPYTYKTKNNDNQKSYYYIWQNNPLTMISFKNIRQSHQTNILLNKGHHGYRSVKFDESYSTTKNFKIMSASNFTLPTEKLADKSTVDEYALTFNENVKVILNGKPYKSGSVISKATFNDIQKDSSLLSIACDPEKDAILLVCGRKTGFVNGGWERLDTWFYAPNAKVNRPDFTKYHLNRMESRYFDYENEVLDLSFSDQYNQDVRVIDQTCQNKLAEKPNNSEVERIVRNIKFNFGVHCNIGLRGNNDNATGFIIGEYKVKQKNTILFVETRKPNSMAILRDVIPEFPQFFITGYNTHPGVLSHGTPLTTTFASNSFGLDSKSLISTDNDAKEYCLTFSNAVNVTIGGKAYCSGDVISQDKFEEIEVQTDLSKSAILTFCKRDVQGSWGKFFKGENRWSIEKAWFHDAR